MIAKHEPNNKLLDADEFEKLRKQANTSVQPLNKNKNNFSNAPQNFKVEASAPKKKSVTIFESEKFLKPQLLKSEPIKVQAKQGIMPARNKELNKDLTQLRTIPKNSLLEPVLPKTYSKEREG